jgi:Replication initiator protein, pSAM2
MLLTHEVVARAADPTFERWREQVAQTGYCARPVRLEGTLHQIDVQTGESREVYSTDHEPDGVLLKACGNRRASRCPSCSETYRRDAFHVIASGLRGGKGIPEAVRTHPCVFATFTAPSFGPVHARRERRGRVRPCRPRHAQAVCPHGRPLWCFARHQPDDPALGRPLCARCFDAEALVLWNAIAPELWRRTTIYLRRALARLSGETPTALARRVRISYAKVAEYQARGAIHFHAVIRLDAAADEVAPPPVEFTVELLARAIREAADQVAVPLPKFGAGPVGLARWGSQLDLRPIESRGELTAEAVAGYIAKYATKAAEDFGPALDRRFKEEEIDGMEAPPHVLELVRACWRLGGYPRLKELRLRQWAHMLGFRGHWQTKSRRYSITFTSLRRTRAEFGRRGGWATRSRWTPGAASSTTRRSSSWRTGPTRASATGPSATLGWPSPPPPGRVSNDALHERRPELTSHEPVSSRSMEGANARWASC